MMSGFLILLIVDWILRRVTRRKRGINWGLETLEDLDFADDLAPLSSSRRNLQEKTNELEHIAGQTGLRITLRRPRL